MSYIFAQDVDFNYNEALKFRSENAITFPTLTTAEKGFTFFHTVNEKFYGWTGSVWIDFSTAIGDDLGSHIATQNLDINEYNIFDVNNIFPTVGVSAAIGRATADGSFFQGYFERLGHRCTDDEYWILGTATISQKLGWAKVVNPAGGAILIYTLDPSGDPMQSTDLVHQGYFDANLAGTENTTAFTPTLDYHVATKKYVDDNAGGGGTISDVAYGVSWDAVTTSGASKNALYDKIETLVDLGSAQTITGQKTIVSQTLFTGRPQIKGTIPAIDFDGWATYNTTSNSAHHIFFDGSGNFGIKKNGDTNVSSMRFANSNTGHRLYTFPDVTGEVAIMTSGTWTPTLTDSFANWTISFTTNSATYIKIGDVVYFECLLSSVNSTGSSTMGGLTLGGLPFTAAKSSYNNVGLTKTASVNGTYDSFELHITGATTTGSFRDRQVSDAAVTGIIFTGTGVVTVQGYYTV